MSTPQNQLIALLPALDRKRFLSHCEPVQLVLNDIICEPGEALRHLYFPIDAFISLLAINTEQSFLEVGMIGREGMLGVHQLLGVTTAPLRALVQGAGLTLRISTPAFRSELKPGGALQAVLLRYVHVCMQQLASSALCMRFHPLGPRLARWLLMTQDRAHSDSFRVTQDFLSSMLGVRRVGVTVAAQALQDRHLIVYKRGDMRVRDRAGLEAAACPCYANDRQAYQAQLAR